MRNDATLIVRLPNKDKDKLKEFAAKQNVKVSELTRFALRQIKAI